MAPDDNGWDVWKKEVLGTQKRHDKWLANISTVQTEILVAIAGLKARSGVWGAIAGFVTVATALGICLIIWAIRGN